MIHRALFGSIERFMALLTEHHKGDFLFWLAPVQVGIVPVRPSHSDYCRRLKNKLMDNGIRAEVNNGDMDMRDKIKGFSLEMIPYVFVAGDRDMEASAFFVRSRKNGKLGQMKLEEFLSYVEPELNEGKAKRVLD
jgi:threonyl-tRNA synthetase